MKVKIAVLLWGLTFGASFRDENGGDDDGDDSCPTQFFTASLMRPKPFGDDVAIAISNVAKVRSHTKTAILTLAPVFRDGTGDSDQRYATPSTQFFTTNLTGL